MKHRISIVTDEISQDLAVCREFLDRNGIRAVELRCVGGRRVPDLEPADLATLRSWVANGEVEVLGVSPGLFKCDVGDLETMERHALEILPRSIELARALDASFLVAFTFENLHGRPVSVLHLEALGAAAGNCAADGLPLLIENEPGFVASTGAEVAALLRAVRSENLFVNWDPANAGQLDAKSLSGGLREIHPWVRHVHVKNGRVHAGERFPAYGPLSEGDIDWPAHLALLDDLEYPGHLGIETHFEPLVESSEVVLRELRSMLENLGEDAG